MIIENLDYIFNKKPNQKLAALDVSKKSIGVAVCDEKLSIAFTRKTINRTKLLEDIAIIKKIIAEENIFALIIGLPLLLDGSSDSRVQSVKTFVSSLLNHIDIAVFFEDERFSTKFAKDLEIKSKTKENDLDSKAAAIILENFLYRLPKKI
jgi:putative Holliday junction resolvase